MTLPARRKPVLTPRQIKAAQLLARADTEAEAKLQAVRSKLAAASTVEALLGDPLVLQEAERILMHEQAPGRRIRVMKQLENIAFADISAFGEIDRCEFASNLSLYLNGGIRFHRADGLDLNRNGF